MKKIAITALLCLTLQAQALQKHKGNLTKQRDVCRNSFIFKARLFGVKQLIKWGSKWSGEVVSQKWKNRLRSVL